MMCRGRVIEVKLKGDVNYQYYQTSGVKAMKKEARCDM
jgi:hypothetical protein